MSYDPRDILIGANVRKYRHLGYMSQQALGQKLNVTFQQVQKYENGTNRISASRLVQIADVFKVSIEDLCSTYGQSSDNILTELASTRCGIDMATNFVKLSSELQREVANLVGMMVNGNGTRD